MNFQIQRAILTIRLIIKKIYQDLTNIKQVENSVENKEITDAQIKQAIEKDKVLQKGVIEALKKDEESKDVISKLESSNMVSDKNIMKNILWSPNLLICINFF